MAIKINNTVVIDNGRGISGTGLTVTSISAAGSVGSAGSVLTSSGSAIYWSNGSTLVGAAQTYEFTSSGSWTKPSIGTYALVTIWGGGGAGNRNGSTPPAYPGINGGGGGGCAQRLFLLSQLPPSSIPITVGAGVAGTTSFRSGVFGGDTTFGLSATAGLMTAFGGCSGGPSPAPNPGRGGNGFFPNPYGVVAVHNFSPDIPVIDGFEINYLGGSLYSSNPVVSNTPGVNGYFGGGGGMGWNGPTLIPTGTNKRAGYSYWGGGGGGVSTSTSGAQDPFQLASNGPGGNSIHGGSGGLSPNNASSLNGQPKGGGGAGISSTNPSPISGAGGDGYCLIQVW